MGQIHKIKCDVCEKVFEATRSDVKTCSDACRAKKFRRKRKRLVKSQSKLIKEQSQIIEGVLSKMANCEDCGKRDEIGRLTHIGIVKETSLLCYDCWKKKHK